MERSQLTAMTVAQLRDLAQAHNVTGTSKLKKAELIQALIAATTTAAPTGAIIAPRGSAPAAPSSASGSSTTTAAPAAPAIQRGPEPGLPIPDVYNEDRVVLMAQDPWHIFAYWEVSPARLAQARATLGDHGSALLIITTANGREMRDIDLAGGSYYVTVAPNTDYSAEIALRGADGRLEILANSNRIRTPADRPSERTDEAWMAIDETFEELLDRAGLPHSPGAGGNSAGLSQAANARRIVAWNLTHSESMFSGTVQQAPSSLSSTVLQRR